MNIFLVLQFEYPILTNSYNEIQHFVEKYNLNGQLGKIKLVSNFPTDYMIVFLLTDVPTVIDLEAFLARYYSYNPNKFGADIYPEPDDFKLKPSEIRWRISGGAGGAVCGRKIDWSVSLKHLPTSIYVECEMEGTQKANKAMARRLLTAIVYKTTKEEEEWREYLLGIGVVDLNNEEEISEKLDKVEREDPQYEATIVEALNELNLLGSTPISDVRVWLESLGD